MRVPSHTGPSGDGGGHDPELDNITNRALDAALNSASQTYDQFLQGFIHLTPADVAPTVMRNAFGASAPTPLFLQNNQPARSDSPPLFLQPESSDRLPTPPLVDPAASTSDDEFEEVLDCNIPGTSQANRGPRIKSLQMDNFVDDEGSDEDDDLKDLGSEYMASFTNTETSRRETTEEIAPSLSMPETKCETLEDMKTPMDDVLPERETESQHPVPVACAKKPPVCEEESILDIIEETDKGEESEELVYDPSLDRPNPGEVEDNDDDPSDVVTNLREMTYSARMAEPGELPTYTAMHKTEVSEEDTVLDAIEAFSIDEDFDYDNVILTPKFTPQEQKELDEWARIGREESEAAKQSNEEEGDEDS